MAELISMREFARRKGVQIGAVQRGLQTGRIYRDENKRIDWETQSVDWEQNRDTSSVRSNAPKSVLDDAPDQKNPLSNTMYQSRAMREHYGARTAKVKYEQLIGDLIPKSELKVELFNATRGLRDNILNIPERVASSESSLVLTYLTEIAISFLSPDEASKLIDMFSSERIEAIVRKSWVEESRKVLEDIADGLINV